MVPPLQIKIEIKEQPDGMIELLATGDRRCRIKRNLKDICYMLHCIADDLHEAAETAESA